MPNRGGTNLIGLMLMILIIGILAALAIPNFIIMQERTKVGLVKSNAHELQMAAEEFAIKNKGVYAKDINDTLPNGYTIIDFLRGGMEMKNPFTKKNTEPSNKTAKGCNFYAGTDADSDGSPDGYNIYGFGPDGSIIITLTSES